MNYLREHLENLDGWVKIGDLVLFDNGQCRAGNKVFDYGVPIDGHVFGGTCLLRRRIDEPEIAEVLDGSQTFWFEYSRVQAAWYRLTPLQSPRFEALQGIFGSRGANIAYRLLGELESLVNLLLATIANVPWFLLAWVSSHLAMLISLIPLLILGLIFSLIAALFGN